VAKPDDNKKEHVINQSNVIDGRAQYVRVGDYSDNEISLMDLVDMLVKRKVLFLSVILMVAFIGVFYALNKPVIYSYFVSVEIGKEFSKGRPLENVGILLNKINGSYIPKESKKFLDKYSTQKVMLSVTASRKNGTDLVFIESKDVLENQSINFEFINNLVDVIVADHQEISTIYRKELELSKAQISNTVKSLKDEEQLLMSRKIRLKDKESFLKKRQLLIEKSLAESKAKRQVVTKKSNTEIKAWSLLMIDNDLRTSRERLLSLEEQLNIGLKEENESLENKIAENIRFQFEQGSKLDIIQLKLDELLDTRALSEPMKSISPVGKSKTFFIVLFLVAGVFVSIVMVMIAEFASKVRNKA